MAQNVYLVVYHTFCLAKIKVFVLEENDIAQANLIVFNIV